MFSTNFSFLLPKTHEEKKREKVEEDKDKDKTATAHLPEVSKTTLLIINV